MMSVGLIHIHEMDGRAAHSSVLAWRIPMDRGTWWVTVHGVAKMQTRLSTEMDEGFPGGSEVKNLPANSGDVGSIPGLRRSPGEGNCNPLQYALLRDPMDRGAWQAIGHGVTKSWTWFSDKTTNEMDECSPTHESHII